MSRYEWKKKFVQHIQTNAEKNNIFEYITEIIRNKANLSFDYV